jgi:signal transduction histidine kinase
VCLDVASLDVEGQLQLEALLDDGETWVLALGSPDALPDGLQLRLRACVLTVPSIARRTLELPALSAAILHTLAQRAGRPTPTLTSRARTLLAAREWQGDVLELEARLASALAGTEAPTLDAVDLGLSSAPPTNPGDDVVAGVAPPPEVVGSPTARVPTPAPGPDPRLEILLAELAHEVLNPLVTVKTFAGHLPQLLQDEALRTQFALRADEAVDRIQQLLDNVIAFARFGTPQPEAVPVGPVLDRLLAEAASELAGRAVDVRRVGDPGVICAGDPAQLEYALRNLMAGVIREAPPRDAFTVETAQNGIVRVQFSPGKAAAARLRRLVSPDGDDSLSDPSMLPLAFSLARATIERNGGRLEVESDPAGGTTLVVRLPTAAAATGG